MKAETSPPSGVLVTPKQEPPSTMADEEEQIYVEEGAEGYEDEIPVAAEDQQEASSIRAYYTLRLLHMCRQAGDRGIA